MWLLERLFLLVFLCFIHHCLKSNRKKLLEFLSVASSVRGNRTSILDNVFILSVNRLYNNEIEDILSHLNKVVYFLMNLTVCFYVTEFEPVFITY